MNIYEKNYKKIDALIGGIENLNGLEEEFCLRLKSNGYMDLVIEKLWTSKTGIVISMTHYHEQNGDLVPDPDMQIKLLTELKAAEALTYQDSFGYQEVYPEPGKINPKFKRSLNDFLGQWLTNLKNQGFRKDAPLFQQEPTKE